MFSRVRVCRSRVVTVLLPVAVLCLVMCPVGKTAAEAPGRRPNVLFIAIDDLKPELGCYGVKQILSPNIDALAQRGTIFTSTYCQQAVCAPSRTSLLLGLRPDTTGVYNLRTRFREKLPDALTLPQYFKQQGYYTVGIGKVFDFRSVDDPATMDAVSWSEPYLFVDYLAHDSMGYLEPKYAAQIRKRIADADQGNALFDRKHMNGLERRPTDKADVPDDAYEDGAIALKAVARIKQLADQNQPFFFAVGFRKPHLPFNAPSKYWDLYDRDRIALADFRHPPVGSPPFHARLNPEMRSYAVPPEGPLPDDLQRELIHGYMACVSYVDAQVGLLLNALDEAGVADDTIVVLWGDHGWHLGDHGLWSKHTNFEQATRAPLIIYAPGHGQPGSQASTPSELLDVFPTLCELAGLPVPEQLQGKSLVPAIENPNTRIKAVAVSQFPRKYEPRHWAMGYALRDDRYRYIEWRDSKPNGPGTGAVIARELYDYETDPLETRNLIDDPAYAQTAQRLEKRAREMGIGRAE